MFTTPNVFPPEGFEQIDVDVRRVPRDRRAAALLRLQAALHDLHHFYDQLCPACADFNFAKRTELADLRGRVALLTGGRVKIGYQAGLKLLRAGAQLIVTTRFPRDSAARYAQEPDFEEWGDRLEIFGLDLRHTPSVEAFCRQCWRRATGSISSSTTPARPCGVRPMFYAHMMEGETAALQRCRRERARTARRRRLRGTVRRRHCSADRSACSRPRSCRRCRCCPRTLAARSDLFPEGRLDQDLQQVDLRGRNSWRLLLAEVSSVELLEVQLVNAVAPFISTRASSR